MIEFIQWGVIVWLLYKQYKHDFIWMPTLRENLKDIKEILNRARRE